MMRSSLTRINHEFKLRHHHHHHQRVNKCNQERKQSVDREDLKSKRGVQMAGIAT
jgi:hypothetical protein